MSKPWNEIESNSREYWNSEENAPEHKWTLNSLKYRLAHPGSSRMEEVIADIAKGLSMIMDEMEKEEK